jgi:hypothetical protein
VRHQGRVVGVLCTHDRQGWEGFEHGELPVLEAAAGVLGEALRRDELAQVLHAERAALSASEVRWRALARVLEMVARGNALPETLDLLARTVEEQSASGRCLVLVRAPGEAPVVAAPSLPAATARATERIVLTELSSRLAIDTACEIDVEQLPTGWVQSTLTAAGLRTLRAWPLLCTPAEGRRAPWCWPTRRPGTSSRTTPSRPGPPGRAGSRWTTCWCSGGSPIRPITTPSPTCPTAGPTWTGSPGP